MDVKMITTFHQNWQCARTICQRNGT